MNIQELDQAIAAQIKTIKVHNKALDEYAQQCGVDFFHERFPDTALIVRTQYQNLDVDTDYPTIEVRCVAHKPTGLRFEESTELFSVTHDFLAPLMRAQERLCELMFAKSKL